MIYHELTAVPLSSLKKPEAGGPHVYKALGPTTCQNQSQRQTDPIWATDIFCGRYDDKYHLAYRAKAAHPQQAPMRDDAMVTSASTLSSVTLHVWSFDKGSCKLP